MQGQILWATTSMFYLFLYVYSQQRLHCDNSYRLIHYTDIELGHSTTLDDLDAHDRYLLRDYNLCYMNSKNNLCLLFKSTHNDIWTKIDLKRRLHVKNEMYVVNDAPVEPYLYIYECFDQ